MNRLPYPGCNGTIRVFVNLGGVRFVGGLREYTHILLPHF